MHNHIKMGEPEFIGLTIMSACVLQDSLVGTWEVLCRYRSLHSQNPLVMGTLFNVLCMFYIIL